MASPFSVHLNRGMGYISIGAEKLHFERFGTGNKIILAFHGYGTHGGNFSVFEAHLGDKYTILSFDLPYHGHTTWGARQHLTEADLSTLVDNVKTEFGVSKVSLMGYSIGGRVCLSVLKAMPSSIDRVLLLSSDGLAINFFYYFATHTLLGGFLFRFFLRHYQFSLGIATWLKRAWLLPESKYKMATRILQSEEKREQLLKAWPCLCKLVHRPALLRAVITEYKIPVSVFMGRHDKVLPPALAYKFAKGAPTVRVFVLDKGHRIFDESNAQHIAQQLL